MRSPERIQKWYEDRLGQYERIHDALHKDLAVAVEELDRKDLEVRELLAKNTSLSESERKVLESRNNLQRQIGAIQFQAEQMKPLSFTAQWVLSNSKSAISRSRANCFRILFGMPAIPMS